MFGRKTKYHLSLMVFLSVRLEALSRVTMAVYLR